MEFSCSVYLTLIFITVSVRSECIYVNCRPGLSPVKDKCCKQETILADWSDCCEHGLIPVNTRCRRRVRRSIESDAGCEANNKIYITDEILNTPGPLSIECPNGYMFNGNMQCQFENWEPDSGPWETHHYTVRGRRIVIEMRRSDLSIKYRSLNIDNN